MPGTYGITASSMPVEYEVIEPVSRRSEILQETPFSSHSIELQGTLDNFLRPTRGDFIDRTVRKGYTYELMRGRGKLELLVRLDSECVANFDEIGNVASVTILHDGMWVVPPQIVLMKMTLENGPNWGSQFALIDLQPFIDDLPVRNSIVSDENWVIRFRIDQAHQFMSTDRPKRGYWPGVIETSIRWDDIRQLPVSK
jgi:hypothetical protein